MGVTSQLPILIAGLAFASSAHAETTLSAHVSVFSATTGTASKPAGATLSVRTGLSEPRVIRGLEVWTGPGIRFDHRSAPVCDVALLRTQGPSGCPSRSIVGTGAMSGPDSNFDLPAGGGGRLAFVNAPGGKVVPYATVTYPAPVRAVLGNTVVDRKDGRWPHRDAWTLPTALQESFGNPVPLDALSFSIGYPKAAKLYVSTTSCPRGGWRWRVLVHTWTAPGKAATLRKDGRVPCRG